MHALKLVFIFGIVLLSSCSISMKYPVFDYDMNRCLIADNDSAYFKMSGRKHIIDSVLFVNKAETYIVNSNVFKLPIKDVDAGNNMFELDFHLSNGKIKHLKKEVFVVSDIIPKTISVDDYQTIPHDESAFTQGLIVWNDYLYESTGLVGESSLRIINSENGHIIKQLAVSDSLFAEGIEVVDNSLVMLTWKDGKILRYNKELELLKAYPYGLEGWGLTSIKDQLVASDGSDKLFYLDESFETDSSFQVFNHLGPVYYLNELEEIDGRIWSNVLGRDYIYVINPQTGKVEIELDLSFCIDRNKHADAGSLNGIAYNKQTNTVYFTGKNWPYIIVWDYGSIEILVDKTTIM